MTIPKRFFASCRNAFLIAALAVLAQPAPLFSQIREGGVVHARLAGAIDSDARRHIERALADASSEGAATVLLDLDSRGGSVADAQSAVGSIVESTIPVYAFVNSAAWGAGALIALAADSIFMEPDGTIGWGDLSEEEGDISAAALRELRSEFRVLAVRRGLNDQVAVAMVDPDVVIEGLVEAGKRLTLSSDKAIELGFAAGEAEDVTRLLGMVGLEEAELGAYSPNQIQSGITITVSNNNWRDVRINLMFGTTGSISRNLGHVTSMNTQEFEIPLDMVTAGSRVRAVAEVIGSSERAITEWITAQPGLAIDWIIANVISQSNYFAYIRN